MSQGWGQDLLQTPLLWGPLIPVVLASRPDQPRYLAWFISEDPPSQKSQTTQQSLKSDTSQQVISFGSSERNTEPIRYLPWVRPGSHRGEFATSLPSQHFRAWHPAADTPHQIRLVLGATKPHSTMIFSQMPSGLSSPYLAIRFGPRAYTGGLLPEPRSSELVGECAAVMTVAPNLTSVSP